MRHYLFWLFGIMILGSNFANAKQVDMVIFSFDRPMQLSCLLRSMNAHMTGLGQVTVVYRSSDTHFEEGYTKIKENFPNVVYYKQGHKPRADFVPLTKKATFESPNSHIIFAVDDIIVTRSIDLEECTELLEKTGAYGFYLRLGKNINYCYMQNLQTPMPSCKEVSNEVFQWNFGQAKGDWAYPNSVDFVVYKKKDIQTFVNSRTTTPILLEMH